MSGIVGPHPNDGWFQLAGIPERLRSLDRWAVAHPAPQPDGSVKKTIIIAGRTKGRGRWKAESNDPDTWVSFDRAVADATVRHFALAFSFGRETGLWCADCDGALDDDGGIKAPLRDLIERADTLVEVSVSGRSLHIIGEGVLPDRATAPVIDGCRVELYPKRGPQWILVTGFLLPGFEALRDCSDDLPTLFPSRTPATRTRTRKTAHPTKTPEPIPATTLTPDEEAAVVSWAAPLWEPGRRHRLSLALGGYLLLQGIDAGQVLSIIGTLATDDPEREARLRAVRDTIERHQAGEAISGWSRLQDLGLSEAQLRPLGALGDAVWRNARRQTLVSPIGDPTDLHMALVAANGHIRLPEDGGPTLDNDNDDEDTAPEGPTAGRTVEPADAPQPGLHDFVAHLEVHKYLYRPTGKLWPRVSVNASVPPVCIGVDAASKPVSILASDWLDQYAAVHQITWLPGDPELIQGQLLNSGGWITRPDFRAYNLYKPPTIAGGDPALAGPWVDHVRTLYGEHADHILQWFAQRVQRPQQKINHALLLGGQQGCGKDSILKPVRQAIGPWNYADASPSQVMGRFNGFLKSVILLVPELCDLGDVDRYAIYEHLKPIIAAPPDVLRCDEKYLAEIAVPNITGVIFTSNQRIGIYLPSGDRRHFAAWSDLEPTQFPAGYFDRLHHWLDHEGGSAHVAAYLQTVDLSAFNPTAPPPKTDWYWGLVDAGRAPEESELSTLLDAMAGSPGEAAWPEAVTLAQLIAAERQRSGWRQHDEAHNDFATWLEDRKNRRQIPHRMEAVGYIPLRNDAAKDGLWSVGGVRMVIYVRQGITRRDQLAAASRVAAGGA